MSPLLKWICPKCGREVLANATQVVHRCPSNQNKPTNFNQVAPQD